MIVSFILHATLAGIAFNPIDDPYLRVKETLANPFKENVELIMTRQSGGDSQVMYKITYLKGQMMKGKVLHPVMYQDQSFTDNGKELFYYDAGKKILIQTESPYANQPSIATRLALIKTNYSAKITRSITVAGRDAIEVKLAARQSEMGVRLMAIDRSSNLLLQYTLEFPNQKVEKILQVLSIELHNKTQLSLDTVPGVRLEKPWGPIPINDLKHATGIVGFRPVTPVKLPYGFKLYSQRIVGEEEEPVLESSITDGLALISIYQWSKVHGRKVMSGELSRDHQQGDVYCTVIGSLPKEIEAELVRAFRPSASRPSERSAEPDQFN